MNTLKRLLTYLARKREQQVTWSQSMMGKGLRINLNTFFLRRIMADSGATLPRDFSRVVLTLENVLISDEKLSVTPSMLDGLDKEIEQDLRILGCEMIQTAGILLKLPQVSQHGRCMFSKTRTEMSDAWLFMYLDVHRLRLRSSFWSEHWA